ncbi:MAG TPA: agmatine deiminase family protein [Campylobacterales bacterium]|nr:agmatine deiminase family protein [Campylobacterales bacterium]
MIRLPAEWEKQEMILMAFPALQSDWADDISSAYSIFIKIASAISYNQKLILLVPPQEKEKIKRKFCYHDKISFVPYDIDDTWIRDYGPISVIENSKRVLKDFIFNGWGDKFPHDKDNLSSKYIHKNLYFGLSKLENIDFILEGGSIDSDGNGTILTTSECLLNKNRNNKFSKTDIEAIFKKELGIQNTLWLNHGYLSGDDTDGHIDMLARFVSRETIVYLKCYDKSDEHFQELEKMEKELKSFKNINGDPYKLIPLPLTKPIYKDNKRLPASYVNFLIINSAVLLPIYKDESDKMVIEIFKNIFKDREIIPLDSRRLIEQGGSIHCSTMQVILD